MSPTRRPRERPHFWKPMALIMVVGILAAVIAGALVMTTAEPGPDAVEPQALAVVGDSNTEMDSPDFAAGQIGEDSWVSTVLAAGHRFAGGWAVAGSTSVDQAAGLEAVQDAEVLLVMTGTNDLAQGVPFEQTAPSLEEIVAEAPAERVVLLAIPPRDEETTPSSTEFNVSLQNLAEDQGWEYFDGLEFLRGPEGGFVEGTTDDGVHLTPEAQDEFGETVADYLAEDDDAS
ncbi:SGNH/GDSL hydrolase family protein [Nesterenkonia sp. E16_7]|uniref:SGNH/GDSL hydrolase family protein n=1 Tax=unclassified Nesterenkonia TaxID=2629769 RepID=UPI001A92FF89|nr:MULTISPECIES: SGNH/GDSL hydrolase family protein [unclassified Nesterenkonia]MBO0594594.1 SGNH/GDSL hydrolase family protein [Nesterenkonia sp. E16_10]MBO0599787.1 SGNH/GDSL hydrolase family protein [Nesterenkonia sp. E16_7]